MMHLILTKRNSGEFPWYFLATMVTGEEAYAVVAWCRSNMEDHNWYWHSSHPTGFYGQQIIRIFEISFRHKEDASLLTMFHDIVRADTI